MNADGALMTVGGELDQGVFVSGESFGEVVPERWMVMVCAVGVMVTVGETLDHVGWQKLI